MKTKSIALILILATAGSPMAWAEPFDPIAFANATFNDDATSELATARKDYMKIKNLINRKKKADEAYGAAIGKTFNKAMSVDPAAQLILLNLLQAKLLKDFQLPELTVEQSSPGSLAAQEIMGASFEKNSHIPYGYLPAAIDAAALIRSAGINPTDQALRIDSLITYFKTYLKAREMINTTFNTKSIDDATQYILTQTLKDKNPIESRLIINVLIDKLLEKTGARLSQQLAAQEGKAITQETIDLFKNANATTMDTMSNVIQQKILKGQYSPEKLFLMLTAVRNVLIFAVTPAPLPQASAWEPPRSCPWYDLSCSIPWNKVGDGLKYAFSDEVWKDTIGGGLKVAFVDNVYEKGIKKLGELINDNIVKPARDKAHGIADGLKNVANKLSNAPNEITTKTADIIGKPTLSEKLTTQGIEKLGKKITEIKAAINKIKKQKQDLIAMNLPRKKIAELTQLNGFLIDAFNELQSALEGLANEDCSSGVLCEMQNAFRRAVPIAEKGQIAIRQSIENADQKINHAIGIDSLPTRLRNFAKALDL